MADAAPVRICRVCKKDLSAAKRVRGDEGHYYCPPCLETWRQGGASKAHAAPAARPATSAAAKAPADDTYDLLPTEPAPKPNKTTAVQTVATTNAPAPQRIPSIRRAASKPAKMPKFCPNCDAPVLPNRKLCVKCHRDVTQMDVMIALKEEAAKGPPKEEVIATWVSRGIRGGLIVVAVAVAIFGVWGLWMMLHPVGAYDEFPTRRAQAVSEFLGHIAGGTDAEYEKAFFLLSIRERVTNNPNEIDNYKRLFAKIHDELAKKHGDNWPSKMKVEPLGDAAAPEADEEMRVTIDTAEYHVGTQVQIPVEQAVANLASRTPQTYPENGKYHFGILEVAEFPLATKHH